jgi:hypothetical protein
MRWLILLLLLTGCSTVVDSRQVITPVSPIYLPLIAKSPTQAEIMATKHGVAVYQGPNQIACEDGEILNAGWWYNWDVMPRWGCTFAENFVPMLWSHKVERTRAIPYARSAGWLMGFNEPDQQGQSNINPRTAAVAWRQIEQQFADVRLVSPAPSQANPHWLNDMVREYRALYGRDPRFDAIGVHIYFTDPRAARKYIEARHNEWPDKPLWVTEYASCLWIKNPDWRLTAELTTWMRQQHYIERYAWFNSRWDDYPDTQHSCVLIKNDRVTSAGHWFVE